MAFTKLDLPGADVAHCPQFLTPNLADHFERILTETLPWKQRQVIIAGVSYDEPRVTAWHGRAYAYSGNVLEPEPMTEHLEHLRLLIQTALGDAQIRVPPLNSVLANLYRAGHRDSIGMHSDNERELGLEPAIASLSLGRTARFRLEPKPGRPAKPTFIDLTHGSLLIMRGQTQRNYKHGIAKSPRPDTASRLNLTFRTIF
jgi:alkylated DNA repair dioxygenase AlkB